MKNPTEPLYFLESDDPVIERYRNVFESYKTPEHHTLALQLNRQIVKKQDIEMVQKVVMALQHYPDLISKFLFCLKFSFTESEDSSRYIHETNWKKDPIYYQWFHKLTDMPFMLFFLHDEEVRLYALMGDIMAEENITPGEKHKNGNFTSLFSTSQWEVMQERLFCASLSLLVYCQNSGFNPEIYVQGILASFDAVFTYEDVMCEYAKDILTGTYSIAEYDEA
jgi:hypothetical protein